MSKISYLFVFFVFVFSCQQKRNIYDFSPVPAQERLDALSASDKTRLFTALQQINVTGTWYATTYQQTADLILTNTNYSATAYRYFFTDFFTTEPLSFALYDYLWYRFFSWGTSTQRLKHQQALSVYFQPSLLLIEEQSSTYKIQLYSFLLQKESLLSIAEKDKIFNDFKQIVRDTPWMKNQTLQVVAQIAWMNAIVNGILSYKNINAAEKAEYIQLFELQGAYAELMQAYGVYLFDNYQATSAQLSVIDQHLRAFPSYLLNSHRIKSITMRNNYPAANFQVAGTFNIFNTQVGGSQENGFPSDVSAYPSDLFAIVLAHEIAHQFDPIFLSSSYMQKRKTTLLQRAGVKDSNYLRSMIGGAFFQANPQEFIASIFNQYTAYTLRTWEIATKRFAATKEPMHQFVFILDLLSNFSENTSYFYQTDLSGKITRYPVSIERNSKKYIQKFTVPYYNLSIQLTLDTQGNITRYKQLSIN